MFNRKIETIDSDWDDFNELPWTDEDEAGLEEWEERRRERLAELSEY